MDVHELTQRPRHLRCGRICAYVLCAAFCLNRCSLFRSRILACTLFSFYFCCMPVVRPAPYTLGGRRRPSPSGVNRAPPLAAPGKAKPEYQRLGCLPLLETAHASTTECSSSQASADSHISGLEREDAERERLSLALLEASLCVRDHSQFC